MNDQSEEIEMDSVVNTSAFVTPKRRKRTRRTSTAGPPGLDTDSELESLSQISQPSTSITQSHPNSTTQINQNAPRKNPNYSKRFKETVHKTYNSLFYIKSNTTSRIEISQIWNTTQPNNKDVLLQTKQGFLLKTNSSKIQIINALNQLQSHNLIIDFKETHENTKTIPTSSPPTFSVVIATVEAENDDNTMSDHLLKQNIEHRYCKRITAKATGKRTNLIRIITGCEKSFHKIMNEGVFFLCKHYPVYPSAPPPPSPSPCAKCAQFTNSTINCPNKLTCQKCQGEHSTNSCTSNESIKCATCKAIDNAAI